MLLIIIIKYYFNFLLLSSIKYIIIFCIIKIIMSETKLITLKSKNKLYKFRIVSINEKKIEFKINNFTKIINKDEVIINLNKLNSNYLDSVDNNIDNKKKISDKIADYIEFIQIINNDNQINTALEQMMLLIWNNMWILKFKFIEYKIRKFIIKYSKIHFFLLFCLESEEEIKINNFDSDKNYNNSDIDWELDNFNYTEYIINKEIYDFIF